ncbi:MAG: hypothetical protein WBD37_13490 [Anderseniella sp.]
MTNRETRLQQVLSAYGRNPLRWPQEDRIEFADLLRKPELLPTVLSAREHELDRLLDAAGPLVAPEPAGARNRLLERIAEEKSRSQSETFAHQIHPGIFNFQRAMAAGVLAASIAVGIFAGLDSDRVSVLADSLQLQTGSDSVLDVVLIEDSDEGGLL